MMHAGEKSTCCPEEHWAGSDGPSPELAPDSPLQLWEAAASGTGGRPG